MATVYWNTDGGGGAYNKGLAGEERHSLVMDWHTHEYLHETVGSRFESGLTGTFDNTTITIETGVWHDEDIEHAPAQQTTCNVLYKNGSANFEWDAGVSVYYKLNGTALRYNNGNALADCTPNRYMAMWVFATNDISVPIVALMGQRQDTTLANARENNTYESLTLGTLPYKEMKLLYRVILRSTGSPPTYTETQDLRAVSNLPAGTYVATLHGVLSGLTNDDHTQYLLADGTRALAGAWDMGSQALTNVNIDSGDINVAVTNTEWDAAYTHSQLGSSNPHSVTPTELGLVIGTNVQAFAPVLTDLATLGVSASDGQFIVATGIGAFAYESGATLRTSIGVGTGNSPQFTGLTLSGITQGSVVFAGASGVISQNNSNLFWDDSNNRLGIGTASPETDFHIKNSGGIAELLLQSLATTDATIRIRNGASSKWTFGNDASNDEFIISTGSILGTPKLTILQGGNVGIGTGATAPNAPLEVKGIKPGEVGGWQGGQLQVTGSVTDRFYSAVITGHNAYDTNTQLWYLGSTSASSHDDIGFINRQNAALHLATNNITRITIDATGNVTLTTIAAEGSDVDKFLVSSTGVIKYRTGTQVLSDIGASASGHNHSGVYEPADAGLTSLAGLGYVSDSFIKVTAEDTYVIRTIAQTKTDLSLNLVENTAHSSDAHTMTIDGRDVSVDGSKLDGIEALADVTSTNETSHANVLVDGDFGSAGLMNTDGAGAYSIKAIGTDVQAYHANLAAIAGGTWTGAASITTLGTIATGTWASTDVGIAYGGTGQSTAQLAINALSAVSGGTNEHVLTKDTGTGNAIWKAAASGGGGGQIVHTKHGEVKSFVSPAIPDDDSIPQNSEGQEYTEVATTITPAAADSTLVIDVLLNLSLNNTVQLILALFQDDTANALMVSGAFDSPAFSRTSNYRLRFAMPSGSIDARTYKVRIGVAGVATTITANGWGGVRKYGGVCYSSMTVTEIP